MKILRGEITPDYSITWVQSYWKYTKDLMLLSPWMNNIISNNFRDLLVENNITWWNLVPVKLKMNSWDEIKWYHILQVTGNSWRIKKKWDDHLSAKVAKGWDGSDMYIIEWTLSIHVTPKVKKILEEADITGVRFEESFVIE